MFCFKSESKQKVNFLAIKCKQSIVNIKELISSIPSIAEYSEYLWTWRRYEIPRKQLPYMYNEECREKGQTRAQTWRIPN